MLLQRIVTAAVLLLVLAFSLMADSRLWFELLMLAFTGAAVWEWLRLCAVPSSRAMLVAVLCVPLFWAGRQFSSPGMQLGLLAVVAVLWVVYALPHLYRGLPPVAAQPQRTMLGAFGVVALAAAWVGVLAALSHGAIFCLSLLSIVWVADIGAYFFGKTFGKHKLAPSISPGKTWEGALGGLLCVTLYSGLWLSLPAEWAKQSYMLVLIERYGPWVSGLMLGVLVALSIGGDLFESMLKRRVGMKDSSKLLPGHGGVLDRVDALLPVLPVAMSVLA